MWVAILLLYAIIVLRFFDGFDPITYWALFAQVVFWPFFGRSLLSSQ